MKSKIKAFKVSEEALKQDRMLHYSEICDGEQEMTPVTMRPARGIDYHVLEDIHGNVFILKSKYVVQNKLDKRPLGEPKTDYLLPSGYQKSLPVEESAEKVAEEFPKKETMEKLAEIRERSEAPDLEKALEKVDKMPDESFGEEAPKKKTKKTTGQKKKSTVKSTKKTKTGEK